MEMARRLRISLGVKIPQLEIANVRDERRKSHIPMSSHLGTMSGIRHVSFRRGARSCVVGVDVTF
jgi:hypothetical protein